jgi:HlyD family secretion protein
MSPRDVIAPGSRRHAGLAVLWAHRWFALAAVVLAGLGGWQATRVLLGPAVVVDVVQRGALVETVVVSGHVETPYRVEIGSQITGTVAEVLVEEGERVTKGQRLIMLEAQELDSQVVQAQGAVAQAEARMRQLTEVTLPAARESLDEAQANLLDAQKTFDRANELARNGYATRAALDDARRDMDVARTRVRAAELQVFTNAPGGSDYVMAETQLAQARANLATARSRLGYATIAAPRDGVLITRAVERGTVAEPGKALLVLAPDGDVQLVLAVDERDLGKLALGQKAIASADAYPDQRFDAVLTYINPGVDITRAAVQVKLTASHPPAYLRQDMTVSVDIEAGRRDDALVLPSRSVRDALSGSPWIMGVRDGRAVKMPVTLGLRGNALMEIAQGANAGDAAVPFGAGLLLGQRLRPIRP